MGDMNLCSKFHANVCWDHQVLAMLLAWLKLKRFTCIIVCLTKYFNLFNCTNVCCSTGLKTESSDDKTAWISVVILKLNQRGNVKGLCLVTNPQRIITNSAALWSFSASFDCFGHSFTVLLSLRCSHRPPLAARQAKDKVT